MLYKALLIIPLTISFLTAQTPDYPDTSEVPDTSTYPDTTTDPESTPNPDTSEFEDTLGYNDTTSFEESMADDGAGHYGAPNNVYLGVGIGSVFNLETDNPSYQAFLGKNWGLGDYIAFNGMVEGVTDFDNTWFVDAVLSLDLYPLPSYTALSPYIGVGAGVGWATNTDLDQDGFGFNLSGKIGLRLFKNSPFGLIFEANVDWLFNEVINDDYPVVVTGRAGITF